MSPDRRLALELATIITGMVVGAVLLVLYGTGLLL